VAVDSGNNVIVAGYTGGDYATIKYSSAGEQLWVNTYNGPWGMGDRVTALVVDGSDNVIVTGCSTSASTNLDYWQNDYLTIKYSSAGEQLWVNTYNGPGDAEDMPRAVAVDRSNNVIVTGYSFGSRYAPHNEDYLTIKYSSDGVPLWTNRYNGPGNSDDSAGALAVDGDNDVIVTGGSFNGTNSDQSVTIKYSSAGVPLWTNRCHGLVTGSGGASLAVDGSNNVIIGGGSDYCTTIKYSSTGVPLWTNLLDSGSWAYVVAVDRRNNVIVMEGGYATVAYSSAGLPLWTNRYSNMRWDDSYPGSPMAIDHSGNVILTGENAGDFVTVKYLCVPSPAVTGLQRTNGTFQMRVDNVLQPGTLVIEASTNLAAWTPVFTNTALADTLFYTDPQASNYRKRFYRAFQFP
jgi:hypothetical protein